MKLFKSVEAYDAAGDKCAVPVDYMRPMFALTMRSVEFDDTSARAYFTPSRYLEVAREGDGSLFAWTVGTMEVSGRQVITAVALGEVATAAKLAVALRRAKDAIAEVQIRGSSAATLLGEGTASGRRVFLYAWPDVDPTYATVRLASFVDRHGVELIGVDFPAKAKRTTKAKVAA